RRPVNEIDRAVYILDRHVIRDGYSIHRQPLAFLTPTIRTHPLPCPDCCRMTTNLWHEPSRRCRRRPGYVTTMAGGVGPGGRKWHHRDRPECRPAFFHANSRVFRACRRVDCSSVV